MKEKREYLEGTTHILRLSQKEKKRYKVKILGKYFIVHPNVFSPKYFFDTEFFAKELPVRRGEKLLEMGPGTGVVSIFAVWKGASKVVAIDINPSAVKNAQENVKLHGLQRKITVLEGDLYSPLRKGERFDSIFWNTPFWYVSHKKVSHLEKATFDLGYRSTKRFIKEAGKYLKSNGRLLIGFSSTLGHMGELKNILKSAGYKFKVIKRCYSTEVHPVKFELIEAKLR